MTIVAGFAGETEQFSGGTANERIVSIVAVESSDAPISSAFVSDDVIKRVALSVHVRYVVRLGAPQNEILEPRAERIALVASDYRVVASAVQELVGIGSVEKVEVVAVAAV